MRPHTRGMVRVRGDVEARCVFSGGAEEQPVCTEAIAREKPVTFLVHKQNISMRVINAEGLMRCEAWSWAQEPRFVKGRLLPTVGQVSVYHSIHF